VVPRPAAVLIMKEGDQVGDGTSVCVEVAPSTVSTTGGVESASLASMAQVTCSVSS
jgi:hypothetical protein